MFIVAATAVMPVGATALATNDAFAGKKKHKENSFFSICHSFSFCISDW
jgi:hypothetical protein